MTQPAEQEREADEFSDEAFARRLRQSAQKYDRGNPLERSIAWGLEDLANAFHPLQRGEHVKGGGNGSSCG